MKCAFIPPGGAEAPSPPSRGAWIEMLMTCVAVAMLVVAPLAGGVD